MPKTPPKDLDFTIIGDTIKTAHMLLEQFGGALQTEALFGAAHWTTPTGERIDLTTGRAERYERPGNLPSVCAAPLRQDLQRRDFSINMMALHINPGKWGELVDIQGGLKDLSQKQLRVTSGLSFTDDPTRLFRAARYAARLGLTLHTDTADQLNQALKQTQRQPKLISTRSRNGTHLFGSAPSTRPNPSASVGCHEVLLANSTPSHRDKFHSFEMVISKWVGTDIDPVSVGWIIWNSLR